VRKIIGIAVFVRYWRCIWLFASDKVIWEVYLIWVRLFTSGILYLTFEFEINSYVCVSWDWYLWWVMGSIFCSVVDFWVYGIVFWIRKVMSKFYFLFIVDFLPLRGCCAVIYYSYFTLLLFNFCNCGFRLYRCIWNCV
jgi:hypothetical protein